MLVSKRKLFSWESPKLFTNDNEWFEYNCRPFTLKRGKRLIHYKIIDGQKFMIGAATIRKVKPEWICMVCKGPLGYTPSMCCDGNMCGCRGLPTGPPICSDTCYAKWELATPEEGRGYLKNLGL